MKTIAVVTGSSRGIGAATAIRLAEEGYDVCINYHKNKTVAEELGGIARCHGANCIVVQADVSDPKQVKLYVSAAMHNLAPLQH